MRLNGIFLLMLIQKTKIKLMKKITVAYWKENNLIPYFENNMVFDYSIEKQNEIIQIILNCGLSVMIKPFMGHNKDVLLIYISKGKFVQS